MRRLLLILAVAAASVALAWWLATLSGHFAVQLGPWSIETPIPVAIVGVLLLALILHWLLRLLGGARRLPGRLALGSAARRARHGQEAITQTLLTLAAGDANGATATARRATRLLGETPQTLLLTAEAARLAGHDDQAETAFRTLAAREDAAFLGLRGLLRQAIAREDWAEAAALAKRAEIARPGAAWLRTERARLAIRTGNWAEALSLSPPGAAEPRAALAAAAAQAEPDARRARDLAKQAWKADPTLAPAALAYARALRAAGKERAAQSVLREAWTRAPHPDLAAMALEPLTTPLARAQAAQQLASARPADPESMLLLGETALAAGLTGEARRQAEAARAAGLTQRRVFLLLAAIAEAEATAEATGPGAEAAREAQRQALRAAALAEPDPGWRCSECHASQPQWHAACPACGNAGTLRWESPKVETLRAVEALSGG